MGSNALGTDKLVIQQQASTRAEVREPETGASGANNVSEKQGYVADYQTTYSASILLAFVLLPTLILVGTLLILTAQVSPLSTTRKLELQSLLQQQLQEVNGSSNRVYSKLQSQAQTRVDLVKKRSVALWHNLTEFVAEANLYRILASFTEVFSLQQQLQDVSDRIARNTLNASVVLHVPDWKAPLLHLEPAIGALLTSQRLLQSQADAYWRRRTDIGLLETKHTAVYKQANELDGHIQLLHYHQCRLGRHVEVDHVCYTIHYNKQTWSDANQFCQKTYGWLPTVINRQTVAKIINDLFFNHSHGSFWIGLYRDSNSSDKNTCQVGDTIAGTWTWVESNAVATSIYWKTNEPSDCFYNKPESCVEALSSTYLNDKACSDLLPFACSVKDISVM